jgi:hypothetical protein
MNMDPKRDRRQVRPLSLSPSLSLSLSLSHSLSTAECTEACSKEERLRCSEEGIGAKEGTSPAL